VKKKEKMRHEGLKHTLVYRIYGPDANSAGDRLSGLRGMEFVTRHLKGGKGTKIEAIIEGGGHGGRENRCKTVSCH